MGAYFLVTSNRVKKTIIAHTNVRVSLSTQNSPAVQLGKLCGFHCFIADNHPGHVRVRMVILLTIIWYFCVDCSSYVLM